MKTHPHLENSGRVKRRRERKLPHGATEEKVVALRKRFNNLVAKGNPCECWEWMGTTFMGYGYMKGILSTERAHRVAYFLHHGTIDPDLMVCHSCDNPGCVNPNHLWQGTGSDNMRDMVNKGRNFVLRGTQQIQAKLNSRKVKTIKRLLSSGKSNQMVLSERYGVTQQLISLIVHGKKWAHIK